MAISTAQNILTEVMAHYKGIDSTTALSYIAITVDDLCKDLSLVTSHQSLAFTSGTGEYSFSSGSPWYTWGTTNTATSLPIAKITSAFYRASSTSYNKLIEISPDELTARTPEWRYQASGTPQYIYTENDSSGIPKIGVYPKPDTTSTPADGSGYPRLDFEYRVKYGSTFTNTSNLTSTTIPSSITDPNVIIYGALWRIHYRENGGDPGPHYAGFKVARTKLSNELSNRLKGNHESITPLMRPARVI